MKQKNYSNNKLASKQKKFIHAIEGIGDILVFETKRRTRNDLVIQWLNKIETILKDFFAIQKSNPERFEQLLLSQDFVDLYKENKEDAQFRLSFAPDKYLITFSATINQILRIHDAAIETNNDEISRFAAYHLNWILADISKTPKNDLFVEQLLKNLAKIKRLAIEKQDSSMYAASIHWYTDIVFNRLRQNGDSFDLSYLNLFDKYFFSSVKYIVAQNQTALFENLVSSLVEGIHIPSYHERKIWDYGHIMLNSDFNKYNKLEEQNGIEKRLRELTGSEKDLDTIEKLNIWLGKFDAFKEILVPHFTIEQKQKANEIEEEIKEHVYSQFKYNNLIDIVFAIGAYCLFKQKTDYVKYLWEYKQPSDADASWAGHDIVPNSLDNVISLYFKKSLFERKFDFWEDHHGSKVYYEKYFLLLLTRAIQSVKPNSEGKYEQIENYNLPKLHVYRLSDLKHSTDGLIELARDIKKQTEVLRILGLDITQLDEIFDIKLIPFLQSLKTKTQERIKTLQRNQKTSPNKIEEFKEQFIRGFNESVVLRDILKHYNLYEDKTTEYKDELVRFGTSIVDDKAAFFEEWHVRFLNWGNNYGGNLASGEDSDILVKLLSYCIKQPDFEKTLEKIFNLSDVIIISNTIALHKFFEDSTKFKQKWHRDSSPLKVRGFAGWYIFKNQQIPVFQIYSKGSDKQIMILNKSRLGKLIQYSPLNDGESSELKNEIFYMNIRAFSENEELLNQFLKNPPKWLTKIGEKDKQKEHLQEKVSIQILERFMFEKHKEFEGYLLKLAD